MSNTLVNVGGWVIGVYACISPDCQANFVGFNTAPCRAVRLQGTRLFSAVENCWVVFSFWFISSFDSVADHWRYVGDFGAKGASAEEGSPPR